VTGVGIVGGLDKPVSLDEMLATGATYRMVDYWTHQGILSPASQGSGHPRTWTERDRLLAALIVKFRGAGFTTRAAVDLATEAVDNPYRMTLTRNGVQIMWEEATL
jgi:hypothetical protein